ncbi:MAG: TetR family transcriptional regulator, partial [Demequinaceae bacterium]|nr:TetR family transcriptional regulator [Demequinaceae bacterium]
MTEHPPRRGRRSTGPDRAATLTAALRIIDAEGVAGLSMRRLGRELDCDPMSLYRHAATKDKLVDAVVEALLMELKVDPADDDWAAQLRGLARQFRGLALAHPNVVPLLVTRPLATP